MNPYDLTQPIQLPENRITRIAKRAKYRRILYLAGSIILIVALIAAAVWKSVFQANTDIPVYIYLLLYLMWMLAKACLCFCGDYRDKKIVQKLKKELDMELTGPYEYNLVRYRTLRHMQKGTKQIFLLQMARQDILLGRPGQARMALAEISVEELAKNQLQTYYLYQTAASYFLNDEKWHIQLEQCAAIPVKGSEWDEAHIRELFAGNEEKLLDALLIWGAEENKKYEKFPRAIFLLGMLILVTGIFTATEIFFPDASYAYYQRSIILLTAIYLCWIVMSVWWLILLCRLAFSLPGKNKNGKGLLILELILICISLNLFGVIAWANIGTKMQDRRSSMLEDLLTETGLIQSETDAADRSEENAPSVSEDTEANNTKTYQTGGSDSMDSWDVDEERSASEAAKGPITAEEFDGFLIPEKLSEQRIFDKQDEEAHIISGDYIGTWCDEYKQESFRLTKDGAYVYIPFLDLYGDTLCEWELVTEDSAVGYMPALKIYYAGRDVGPLVYYINGYDDDYFWCTDQAEVFYRQ